MTRPGACHICGAWPAGCWLGWPGFRRSQPAEIRGKRLRLCSFGGTCHASAILRAEAKARAPWPFRSDQADLRALVDSLRPPAEPPPAPPTDPTDQSTLI